MTSLAASPTVPTELIHRIVSDVVACYIDDLILGPLSLSANQNAAEDHDKVRAYLCWPCRRLLTVCYRILRWRARILSFLFSQYLTSSARLHLRSCRMPWRSHCAKMMSAKSFGGARRVRA